MATPKQVLGRWGETFVVKTFACPRCKRFYTLKRLPPNFKCADVICDFCGYLAQVKTITARNMDAPPKRVLGAAWKPQQQRMKAGIYFPLYLVMRVDRRTAVYYLPTEFQLPKLFKRRAPLSKLAKRAGWQGFTYELAAISERALVRIWPTTANNPQERTLKP